MHDIKSISVRLTDASQKSVGAADGASDGLGVGGAEGAVVGEGVMLLETTCWTNLDQKRSSSLNSFRCSSCCSAVTPSFFCPLGPAAYAPVKHHSDSNITVRVTLKRCGAAGVIFIRIPRSHHTEMGRECCSGDAYRCCCVCKNKCDFCLSQMKSAMQRVWWRNRKLPTEEFWLRLERVLFSNG